MDAGFGARPKGIGVASFVVERRCASAGWHGDEWSGCPSVDALVAEIGSTTTVVSAFAGLREYPEATPCLVGQGVAATGAAAT
jgi:hypothetical protein